MTKALLTVGKRAKAEKLIRKTIKGLCERWQP
jgi:hypothetical protein